MPLERFFAKREDKGNEQFRNQSTSPFMRDYRPLQQLLLGPRPLPLTSVILETPGFKQRSESSAFQPRGAGGA